jgi:hypothetical protein
VDGSRGIVHEERMVRTVGLAGKGGSGERENNLAGIDGSTRRERFIRKGTLQKENKWFSKNIIVQEGQLKTKGMT